MYMYHTLFFIHDACTVSLVPRPSKEEEERLGREANADHTDVAFQKLIIIIIIIHNTVKL